MGLYHDSIAAAVADIRGATGDPVVYRRGAQSVAIVATCAPKQYQVSDAGGVIITYHCHEWLILAGDLVIAGAAVEPQRGDEIVETRADGTVVTHGVMLIPGLNVYDSIEHDLRYRVRTKITKTEAST